MPNPSSAGLPNPSSYVVDAAKGIVVDQVTKLTWQRDSGPGLYDWAKARTHCADLVQAGYDDWRLPTRIELLSLVDSTKLAPSIDTNAFPGAPGEVFWTASLRTGWEGAWYVDFTNGSINSDLEVGLYRVRCVR